MFRIDLNEAREVLTDTEFGILVALLNKVVAEQERKNILKFFEELEDAIGAKVFTVKFPHDSNPADFGKTMQKMKFNEVEDPAVQEQIMCLKKLGYSDANISTMINQSYLHDVSIYEYLKKIK